MTFQSHPWYWRLWRKIAHFFLRRPSHPCLTVPALYRASSAVLEPTIRTVKATQWRLNDQASTDITDHNHGTVRVEVELISDPHQNMDDPSHRITHFPSERLH